jgi:hypothetical protein
MRRGDFVHVATNTNQLNHAPTAFAQADSSFPSQVYSTEIATSSTVTDSTTTTQPLQRSNVSFGADNTQYGSTEPSTSSPRVHPRPSSTDSEHRAKRPRVQSGSTSQLTPNQELCQYWYQLIKSRKEQLQNKGLLNSHGNDVEGPRYDLLGEACQHVDFSFIAFHQALCAWTLNREPVYVVFAGLVDPGTLDSAFEIMQTITRSNSRISIPQLQWFANFPSSVADFSRSFPVSAAAKEISAFLTRMVTHWRTVLRYVHARNYPLLAFEAIHSLNCRSRGLQNMLFTTSRRILNVNDGPTADALNEIFQHDLCVEYTYEARGERPEVMNIQRNKVAMLYIQHISNSRQSVPSNTTLSPVVGQNPPMIERNRVQSVVRPPLATNISPQVTNAAAPPVFLHNFDALAVGVSTGGPGATSSMPVNQAFSQGSRGLQGARRPNHLQIQTENREVPSFPAHTSQSPLAQPPPLPRSSSAGSPVMQQNQVPRSHGQVRTPVLPLNNLLPQGRANSFAFPSPTFSSPGPYGAQITNAQSPSIHLHSLGFQQARGPAQVTSPHHTQTVQSPQRPPVNAPTSPPRRVSVSQNPNYGAQTTNPPTLPYQAPVTADNSHQMLQVQQIPRAERPPSPHGDNSLQTALHQIEVRSPRRLPSHPGKGRFYQFVKHLVYEPVLLKPAKGLRSLRFTVPQDYMRQLSRKIEGTGLPFCYYSEGSYRCRLRMCMIPETQPDPEEHDWVVAATSWPEYIFFELNDKQLELRRKLHFGKDQPVELTDFLRDGENELTTSYPPVNQNKTPGHNYYFAIEIVETISHDAVRNMVKSIRRCPPDQTKAKIKGRLQPSDSDDVIINDETLTISLADPFSATRFTDPVRGSQCKHLECFDLETWLQTRPPKPERIGGGPEQKGGEPSMVDVWRCPICSLDARPVSLWIDEYFAGVRRSLVGNGDMRTKTISVTANGQWVPVLDADDTADKSKPGLQPRNTASDNAGKRLRPSSVTTAPTVIEILDDDD